MISYINIFYHKIYIFLWFIYYINIFYHKIYIFLWFGVIAIVCKSNYSSSIDGYYFELIDILSIVGHVWEPTISLRVISPLIRRAHDIFLSYRILHEYTGDYSLSIII